MVLWPENRHHRFEARWSHLSQGRCLSREEKDPWMDGRTSLMRWCIRLWQTSPHMKWKTSRDIHMSYIATSSSSWCQKLTFPCMWVSTNHGDRCTSPTWVNPTPRGSNSETMPHEDNGLTITQHQARKTTLGWINGKLLLLLWMSTGASTEDGWRFQVMCSGCGCLPWQNGQKAHVCLVEG